MPYDPTESARRAMLESGQPYADLAATRGNKWTTDEVRELFIVRAFLAPFAIVTRKSDGKHGTLEFTHSPRMYFNFVED